MVLLPTQIGVAAADGEFEQVEYWLAGGTASYPRSVSDVDNDGWTLLTWIAISDESTLEHVEFARNLISRGCPVDAQSSRARRRSPRGRDTRQERALEFLVRQGDNGIVWNILSFWRATY